jgi:hypothetical protein
VSQRKTLRDLARGQACQVRLVGICNFDPQTTVLAHLRMAGITGAGQKAPDALGAWACSACHDCLDGRTHKDMDPEFKRLAFLEGMARTQYQLLKDEYLLECVA